jgi:hypothetical protein
MKSLTTCSSPMKTATLVPEGGGSNAHYGIRDEKLRCKSPRSKGHAKVSTTLGGNQPTFPNILLANLAITCEFEKTGSTRWLGTPGKASSLVRYAGAPPFFHGLLPVSATPSSAGASGQPTSCRHGGRVEFAGAAVRRQKSGLLHPRSVVECVEQRRSWRSFMTPLSASDGHTSGVASTILVDLARKAKGHGGLTVSCASH